MVRFNPLLTTSSDARPGSDSIEIRRRTRAVVHLVLAFVLATGLWSPDKALAKKVDCGVLLERMQKTGETPGIELNPADGIITVRLSRDHCQEPIKTWIGRPSPREQKRKQPSQSAPKTAPQPAAQTAPANAPPPPVQTPALPKTRAACDQRLDMLWPESQVIEITGVSYWMSRASTMEFGSEPGVDDVRFVLKALDDSEQIIRYFGVPGEVHGRSLEGLSLADHGLVKRLCFGALSYKKPPSFGLEPASNLIDIAIPDLAAEYKASLERKGKTAKSKSKLEESSWLLWAIIAGGAVLGIGVGAFFFIHRRKPDDGDDGEGEDDDKNEEDQDTDEEAGSGKAKKKKGGLASFFKRGRAKKKKKGSKDGDADAEED